MTRKRRSRSHSSGSKVRVVEDSMPAAVKAYHLPSEGTTRVVTPMTREIVEANTDRVQVRRQLFGSTANGAPVTPCWKIENDDRDNHGVSINPPVAKKRLIFGRLVNEIYIEENVRLIYSIIRRLTGSVGGNGSHGPIYGELTMGSMQKMIDLMKKHTDFSSSSRFIDVGSGIGKPSLHVAQDPGVEFSYGIEVETDRWLLGMSCLKGILDAAKREIGSAGDRVIRHQCYFERGDIRNVQVLDPFTHVYMFSIGFPPTLWQDLAKIWNRSSSQYLICFHGPKEILTKYGFKAELIAQTSTTMHGSKEGHMGYIYKRAGKKKQETGKCDPFFENAWSLVCSGLDPLRTVVEEKLSSSIKDGPSTRTRGGCGK